MDGTDVCILARKLDATAAQRLATRLLTSRGRPLALDASEVEMAGGLALEVLVAAGLQWRADGIPLALVRPSRRFQDVCATLGLDPDEPWRAASVRQEGDAE